MKKVFSRFFESSITDAEFEYFQTLESKIDELFEDLLKRFKERRLELVDYVLDSLSDIIEDLHYYILDVN